MSRKKDLEIFRANTNHSLFELLEICKDHHATMETMLGMVKRLQQRVEYLENDIKISGE